MRASSHLRVAKKLFAMALSRAPFPMLGNALAAQALSKSSCWCLGEFNRSMQHVSEVMIVDRPVLLQASSKQAFF